MVTPINSRAVATSVEADTVNILIVDDLPEKLLVFESILAQLQANLVMVRSGRDALRQLLEREFSVVLLDVNMPDIDGFETAAMIRSYKKTAQTPIIFITAYADDIQTVRGYALGAVDYIATPVVPEILRSKVKVFIDLFRMHRQLRQWADEREALARAEAARLAAVEALWRADFLSEISTALTLSLDSESIVDRLLTVAVPAIADIGAVALFDDEVSNALPDPMTGEPVPPRSTTLRAIAAAINRHASDVERSENLVITLPQRLCALMADVLREGEIIHRDEESLSPVFLREENARTINSRDSIVPVRWVNALPLFARGELAGALLLAYQGTRNYTDNDLALAKEVASRLSIALENSLLYREIQNGDRRKSEFLAMLAHELRNPLAPLRNAVHIIDQLQLDNGTLNWAAQIIGDQVTHIAHIVDDLLDVARIARGKVELRSELLTLSSILQHSLETSRPLIDMRRQQLIVELPPEDLCVRGDIVRLAQVFSNLLNNASKYTASGGCIWLQCQRTDDQAVVSVRDNGVGIASELLPDIFELFRQGAQPIDRAQGGLGVGLTLVKQLVEMHGGSVHAKSQGIGRGAEFVVGLPLSVAPAVESISAVPDNSMIARNAANIPRILIVDDQKSAADSLRRIFEMKGFSAEVAYDGPSALQKAVQFIPEIVVLDIGLPGMDGFELARAMKELHLSSDPFLIALTGYGQSEDVQRALNSGFDVHLVKPVDIPYLFSVIQERQLV